MFKCVSRRKWLCVQVCETWEVVMCSSVLAVGSGYVFKCVSRRKWLCVQVCETWEVVMCSSV